MAKKPKKEAGYKVGRNVPPEHSKWKDGQSGNPKGRPKGSKNFTTLFLDTAFEQLTVPMASGASRKLTRGEIVVLKLAGKAMQGDARAMTDFIKMWREIEEQAAENAAQWSLESADLEVLRATYQRMMQIAGNKEEKS